MHNMFNSQKCVECNRRLYYAFEVCFDTEFELTEEGFTSSNTFICNNCWGRFVRKWFNYSSKQVEYHDRVVLLLLPRMYNGYTTSDVFKLQPHKRKSVASSYKRKLKLYVEKMWLDHWMEHTYYPFLKDLLQSCINNEIMIMQTYVSDLTNMTHIRQTTTSQEMYDYVSKRVETLGVDSSTLKKAFAKVVKGVGSKHNVEIDLHNKKYFIEHDVLSFLNKVFN